MADPEQERRADTVALSGSAAKVAVTVMSTGIVSLAGFLLWLASSVNDLTGELSHMRQIELVRHESLLDDLAELKTFRNRGGRFTSDDGKRHDERIRSLEQYRTQHEAWGRELTGGYKQTLVDIQRRLDNLEKWQGVKD